MNVLGLIITLVIIGAAAWLAHWLLTQFPPPDPLNRILFAAIIVVAVLAIILVLGNAFGVNVGVRL